MLELRAADLSRVHDADVRGHALPGEQSRVIELAYYGGFTHTQIAEMLDMPVGTVKGRMRLGLEKMRREMTGATA